MTQANSEQRYGVAIIGTGWVSTAHVSAWESIPGVDITAVYSRDQGRAEQYIKQYNLQKAKAYSDYDKVLADPNVQIISICTPPNLHVEQGVKAAEAGKALVMEKPLALDLEGVRKLRDAVSKAGIPSVVGFVLRWNPLFEIIKAQLADGTTGNLFYSEVDYFHGIGPWYAQYSWNVLKAMGGSSLLSAGIHAVDGLRWFNAGKRVTEVEAYSVHGKGEPFKEYEYDPTTVLICKFDDGSIGKVASSIESRMPYVFNILLLGDKGSIRNNQLYSPEKFPGQTDWATVPTILPDSGDVAHHPFKAEFEHFIQCLRTGKPSICTIEDAAITHEICFAADMSAEQNGKPVKLPLL